MIRITAPCLLAVFVLSGCAMWSKPPPPPDLSSVAISTAGDPDLDLKARTTIRRVAIGAGSGLVSGAAAGAAGTIGATVFCAAVTLPTGIGPLICTGLGVVAFIPVTAAGAFIGTVGGTATGAIVGGLPRKKATEISKLVQQPASGRNFKQELGTAVRARVPESRQTDRDTALTLVAVELTEVELTQDRSDSLAIKMKASAEYAWGHIRAGGHRRTQNKPTKATCTYEYETEKVHVDEWLVDGAKAFDLAFTDAVDGIARQVANDMQADAPAREAGSSALGVQVKKLPSGDYELKGDTAEDAEARQSEDCLKKLRRGR